MRVSILGVFVLVAIATSEAAVCTTDSNCGSGECCYIRPQFLVASKRQLTLGAPVSSTTKSGVCEKYRNAGDHCAPLETMNGHCGCMSGTRCQWVDDPTTVAPGGRRSMIPHANPGAYKCA